MMIEDFIIPGTKFTFVNDIYQIVDEDFKKKLETFVQIFVDNKYEDSEEIADYEQLPFINSARHKMDWRLRQEDLSDIRKEIGAQKQLSILEVGPYNSWLTHHLYNDGHKVVCVDYFNDDKYGLGCKRHYYNHDWLSIQCNLEALIFFKPCFDMIVLNHGIQFFSDPEIPITQLRRLLKPGGTLMVLGIFIFKDISVKKKEVAAYRQAFYEKNGTDMFMNAAAKGYLDKGDLGMLKQQGMQLMPYKCCKKQNMAARLLRYKPVYYYGCFHNR